MTSEDAANVRQRLAAGSAVVVCRAKASKPDLVYPMTVEGDDGDHLIVGGPFSQSDTLDLGYARFDPEDWFVEHFWRSRWFAIAQVIGTDGATKGWYCDITRPVEVTAGVVRSADLYLDWWVPGDGSRPLVLDEDEFAASDLARTDPTAAAGAQAALSELTTIADADLSAFLADRPFVEFAPHPPGTPIVVRTVTGGQVRWAAPAICVLDSPDVIAYFIPAGVQTMVSLGATTKGPHQAREQALRQELLAHRWTLVSHRPARTVGQLWVTRPGTWFSVRYEPDSDGKLATTYINIERPHRRTRIGFDADDLCLDLTVQADGAWRRKDTDDLVERAALGIYTADEVAAVERAASTAERAVVSHEPPYDGRWSNWQSDPSWTTPTLPAGWAAT